VANSSPLGEDFSIIFKVTLKQEENKPDFYLISKTEPPESN
jgi:hypothetical protein